MILVIDSGNTNAVFALYEEEKKLGVWRCANDTKRSSDEYAVWLLQLMQLQKLSFQDIDCCVIASVVPQTLFHLKSFCTHYFNHAPIIIGETLPPIKILTDHPEEVGADRIINAFAAFSIYQKAAIVVDFGTATNFDVIDESGNYCGGAIAPGILSSLNALYHSTAQLPFVPLELPEKTIGTTTRQAIKSGVFWGGIGMVEGLITRIREERGRHDDIVLATGGFSSLFSEHCSMITHAAPDLTLLGLQKMAQLIMAKKT